MSLRTIMRGLFIVLEGCDRSGKSSQCKELVKKLQEEGINTEYRNFPDRTTETGRMINSYLQNMSDLDDHAIHLLFSANRWEAMKAMKATLESGVTLIVDRYAFSGIAFSAAKGLDAAWCQQPDVGLLSPDLVLFLDLPIDEAEKRGGYGEERYEKRELQINVRQQFMALKNDTWKVVDATPSFDKVHTHLLDLIHDAFEHGPRTPLVFDLWNK
ncbi:thymidylate kinase-domain-containing protein [Spinellus fusiger]|nr:thymidylate kinase-domain-containing protein [Spinellus fusiger]